MHSWPLISDFAKMLQNPKLAFRDPALRDCTIEKNNLGQPKPRSGNFATVYRGFRPDGSEFAIRVFNRAGDERRDRYQIVQEHLKSREVWCLVGFDYDEKGIRSASDGKLYPLLTMDWVPGVTLFDWARDRSRENYRQALSMGADVWLQLVRHLAANQIVHGDLQHGNVLVSSEGYFKLVDYDCLAVPGLLGRNNLEIGLSPYQHPGRSAETALYPGLDNFSALVIYVALRALAAQPSLWNTYVDTPGYDKLLFRREDFENPQASPLYRDLISSPEEQVRDLANFLFQLTRRRLEQVPSLDDVLIQCQSLETILSQRDWDAAVQYVRRMRAGEQIAAHLMPLVDEAQRRVSCREALQRAIESGSEEAIRQCYVPALLDDYPAAAPLVERARQIGQVGNVLAMLEAARQSRNWPAFKQTWKAHHATISVRPEAETYKREMVRLLKAEALRRVMADPRADDGQVLDLWSQLEAAGGHSTAEPLRGEIERRLARRRELGKIQALVERIPEEPVFAYDKELDTAWRQGGLDGYSHAAGVKRQVQAARVRVQQMERALELAGQCALDGERAILAAARKFGLKYHPLLRRRAQQAQQRLKAFRRLQESFGIDESGEEGDPWRSQVSDLAIMEAWRALEKGGGQALVPEDGQCRIQLAAERVPLIKALQLIGDDLPPFERDRRVLRVWKENLLSTCHDARPWLKLYEQARHRQDVFDRLEEAVALRNAEAAARLQSEPCLAGVPLPGDLRERIDDLLAEQQKSSTARRHALTTALLDNDRATFHDLFDAAAVAEICREYPHHRAAVSRWIESEMLPLSRCGLAAADEPVKEAENGERALFWNWPPPQVADRCRLMILREPPRPAALPDDNEPLYDETIGRRDYDQSQGHMVETPPQWHDAGVYVWAIIDVGFDLFHTEPLHLAQLKLAKKRGWFG